MADFRRPLWTMRNRPPIPRLKEEEIIPSSGWTQYPEFHHLLVDLPGFEKDDIKFNVEESGIMVVSGRRRIGEEKQVYFKKSFNVPEDGDIKRINTVFEGDTLKVSIPKAKVAKDLEKPASDSSKDTNNTKEEEDEEEKSKVDQSLIAENRDNKGKIQQEYDESPASSSDNTKNNHIPANSLATSSSETTEKAQADEDLASRCYSEEGNQEPNTNTTLNNNDKSSKQPKTKDQKQNNGRDQGYETSNRGDNSISQTSVIFKIIENKGILIASLLSFTLGVFLSQKFHPLPPSK